jgi:hypothetical protein
VIVFFVVDALTSLGVEGGLGLCPVVEVDAAVVASLVVLAPVVPDAAVVTGDPVVVVTPGRVVASTEIY